MNCTVSSPNFVAWHFEGEVYFLAVPVAKSGDLGIIVCIVNFESLNNRCCSPSSEVFVGVWKLA